MADRRSRESTWKHGWPSVIVVVLVMVAAGFAVGVIAGITWEEPALVVGHLSGQTEAIDWGVRAEDPKAGGLAADDAIPEAGGLAADDALPKPPSVAAAPPQRRRDPPSLCSHRGRPRAYGGSGARHPAYRPTYRVAGTNSARAASIQPQLPGQRSRRSATTDRH